MIYSNIMEYEIYLYKIYSTSKSMSSRVDTVNPDIPPIQDTYTWVVCAWLLEWWTDTSMTHVPMTLVDMLKIKTSF